MSKSPLPGIGGNWISGNLLSIDSFRFSKIGDSYRKMNSFRRAVDRRGISHECVQKESCTEAKVRPSLCAARAVSNICDASNECTKLGGNALVCFVDETGKSSL